MKIHFYNQTETLLLKEITSDGLTNEEAKELENFHKTHSKTEVESIFIELLPGVSLGQLNNPKFVKQANVKLK